MSKRITFQIDGHRQGDLGFIIESIRYANTPAFVVAGTADRIIVQLNQPENTDPQVWAEHNTMRLSSFGIHEWAVTDV